MARLILFFILLLPTPAFSEPHTCLPRNGLIATLQENWNETLAFRALSHTGSMIEAYASPQGTWTIVETTPQMSRRSCVINRGKGWHVPAVKKTGISI